MKTAQFIAKAWNGETKAKRCANVFIEGQGEKMAIYSYGYHYPLLFKVAGKTVRNVRGYSSSTGKHIAWSRSIEAIDIHTLRGFRLSYNDQENLANLIEGEQAYIESLKEQMASKKRKDTQVYKHLSVDLIRSCNNLMALIKQD